MKKFLVLILILAVTPLMAQEQTLLSGDIKSGGFGGPVIKFTQLNDEFGLMVGGRGGWIINRVFVIGGGGYGLTNDIEVKNINSDSAQCLDLGYGGLELEYIAASNKVIHFSVQSLFGAGGVNYRDQESRQVNSPDGDAFWIIEPGLNLMLNVTTFFRIGFGASYRIIADVDLDDLNNADLSGLSAVLTFKFGEF